MNTTCFLTYTKPRFSNRTLKEDRDCLGRGRDQREEGGGRKSNERNINKVHRMYVSENTMKTITFTISLF